MWFYNHDNFRNGKIVVRGQGDIPDTWEGFLGNSQDGRWETEERRGAFDWYLSTLGTIDCNALSRVDQKLVRAALGRCNVFNYTNSAPYLRALALNPKGVHRDYAIAMFFRNRNVDIAAASVIDMLLVSNVVDYATSSNRLQTLTNMLSKPELNNLSRSDFTAITNQLLSSGQPLQWIDVGTNE